MLKAQGLYEQVAVNKKVDSPTGDFLVNQIRAGSLDAVIVYRSNAMSAPANLEEHLDLIEIAAQNATAVQHYAIAQNAKHKQLLRRLFDVVVSEGSKSTFESFGFRWRGE
jgi:ABC-type molybdate transport system substrate-binding protein